MYIFKKVKTLKRNSNCTIVFRDLLDGVKQELEYGELALELLVEISRLSRMPTVIEDRYKILYRTLHNEWFAD
jgi:hypothetical protein